jgi:hypothetical protein
VRVVHRNLPGDTNASVQAEAHIFDNGIHHLILHHTNRHGRVALERDELVALMKFLVEEDWGMVFTQIRIKSVTSRNEDE